MPGKRQPTDVIKANGRKHLSRAEEAQRRAGEVNLSTAKTARPPSWLPEEPKELKKSFRALGRQLIEAKLFTELDRDTLGRYVVAQHQWELASKAAAPGGGGASALVGAAGVALGSMVGSLTVGKKKYAAVEADIIALNVRAEAMRKRLEALVQADAEAFLPVATAYKLPKETPEQQAHKAAVL